MLTVLRALPLAASLACVASCSSLTRVEVAKTAPICEIHKVATVERSMPETPMKGIEDNGWHPETLPYREASKRSFPYTGANTPSCGYTGGQLHWSCPDCVKAETAWIHRHPKLTYPIYPKPDPRQ
jgi:hypothetical protein